MQRKRRKAHDLSRGTSTRVSMKQERQDHRTLLHVVTDVFRDADLMTTVRDAFHLTAFCPDSAQSADSFFAELPRARSLRATDDPSRAIPFWFGAERGKSRQHMEMLRADTKIDQIHFISRKHICKHSIDVFALTGR